jgi:phosphate-selective porin OprO and OprP
MHVSRSKAFAIALSLVALILSSSHVFAQGFYYKEIRRDDRIYVFNNAEEADRFEKSGEMGRALTRPGTGPKGETLVGDSERALQLFYFKYGISEPVPEPAQPTQRIEWRDGKTRITTDLAYLEISNRIMVRYTQEMPPDNVTLPGTAEPGDQRGSFRIRRAKLKLEGWFWRQNNLTYEFQMNWPALNTGQGASTPSGTTSPPANPAAALEDANIAWDPQGRGSFRVLFGQFKVPSGRQQMTSSGNQQFVDRSNVSDEFARGRDTGVAVQGVLLNNTLEYRAGMFNGNGLSRTVNDNGTLQYNARLMWQPNGNQALVQRAWVSGAMYSESDFESTDVPLYAIALNFESNDFHRTTSGNDLKSLVVAVDGIYKFKGLFATGEYDWRQREDESESIFHANGWYVQGGQMLNRARTWEAAARVGQRDVSSLIEDNDVREMRLGLSYYYRRHNLKFQVDAGQLETGNGPGTPLRKDREVRLQSQFIF